MNYKTPPLFLILLVSGLYGAGPYDHTLSFFIRQYPEPFSKEVQALQKTIKKGKIPQKLLDEFCPRTNQGIVATYAGFTAVSSQDGEVRFPRLGQKTKFYYIVTQLLKPIFMIGNTIHHWEFVDGIPSKIYSVERKLDDETQLYYWDVQQAKLPDNNIVPDPVAIVLYAHPKYIVIPTGITLTSKVPQFLLPTVYAKRKLNSPLNSLRFLNFRSFFGPAELKWKKQSDTDYAVHVDS